MLSLVRLRTTALAVVSGTFLFSSVAMAEEVKITDVVGREVTLDLPAEKVFLGFYYPDYMAIGGVEAFEKVVGFSREVWEGWNPASWELFKSAVPSLDELPDVGEVEAGTFSVEKLLALEPEVAVLADWQFQALGPDIARIEEAGINVVVVDYNAETLERHLKSTEVLGLITGETERATELSELYENTINLVTERISKAGVAKPKVYVEFGNKGPAEYGFTYGQNMWGTLATLAGGDNIAAPFVEFWGPMNPEQVLAAKPEVIFIAGRETELEKNEEAMVMGVGIDREEANRRLTGFTERAGWAELPAIQNDKLFAVYQGASRTLADFAMIQFFAKAMYPVLFEDLDPEAAYIDFHKKYLPVVPEGTFTHALTKE